MVPSCCLQVSTCTGGENRDCPNQSQEASTPVAHSTPVAEGACRTLKHRFDSPTLLLYTSLTWDPKLEGSFVVLRIEHPTLSRQANASPLNYIPSLATRSQFLRAKQAPSVLSSSTELSLEAVEEEKSRTSLIPPEERW